MSRFRPIFPHAAPVVCMITGGNADSSNFKTAKASILLKVEAAATAGIQIVQIREKLLPVRLLYELVRESVLICADSRTSVLVNERFDIALAAGASGVHLTSSGLEAEAVRPVTPDGFIIGVSTHTCEEAKAAQLGGADYVLYGPVFDTPSKRKFGGPKGIARLKRVCLELNGFCVIAVGGIDLNNAERVLDAGASGIAAIRIFEREESFKKLAGFQ